MDWTEVVLSSNSTRHIADIRTDNDVVIELQHSPISPEVNRAREAFYGERMLWLVDASQFQHNFTVYSGYLYSLGGRVPPATPQTVQRFMWKWARKGWFGAARNIFFDFGGRYVYWIHFDHHHSGSCKRYPIADFIRKYGGDPLKFNAPRAKQLGADRDFG